MSVQAFKVVAQLVVTHHDDAGNIIGEQPVGEITLYASQFDQLGARVDEAMQGVREHFERTASIGEG